MTALGIDVGGSSVKVASIGPSGNIATAVSDRYQSPDAATIKDAIRTTMARLPRFRIATVGLCLPGLYNENTDCVETAVNVPGIVGLPVRQLVDDALGQAVAPPIITTDAHAAAHDYRIKHKQPGRLLALSLGTGVGGCVLDDGIPLKVSGNAPGHLGHLDVSLETDPPRSPDGSAGTLEAYIGLPALRTRFGDDVRTALAALGSDDPPLLALARAIRICHAIYRPHHIALLGGIGLCLRPALSQLRATTSQGLTSLARPEWTLTCGDDEFHAARGAARLAQARHL